MVVEIVAWLDPVRWDSKKKMLKIAVQVEKEKIYKLTIANFIEQLFMFWNQHHVILFDAFLNLLLINKLYRV